MNEDARDNQKRTPLLKLIEPVCRYRTEPELRLAIVRTLAAYGIPVETNVVCATGAADLVTPMRDTIYEIKHRLTRQALFQAIGQVLLYREAINPEARAIVVGYATPETASFAPHVARLGVEILVWTDQREELQAMDHKGGEKAPSPKEPKRSPQNLNQNVLPVPRTALTIVSAHHTAPHLPSQQLRWNVQNLARERGISGVTDLARKAGLRRQSLYGLWRGEAETVSLLMLTRLAQTLESDPGQWFCWQDARLVWNIAQLARERGIEQAQLSFLTQMYHRSMQLYWHGRAKLVGVAVLDKLARVLELDIGGLFRWEQLDAEQVPSPDEDTSATF